MIYKRLSILLVAATVVGCGSQTNIIQPNIGDVQFPGGGGGAAPARQSPTPRPAASPSAQPTATPTPAASHAASPAPTTAPSAEASVTPGPTPTATPTPTPTATVAPQPTTFRVNAAEATQWDPARTAYATFDGDVAVQVGGDMGPYNAVICEYATANGRQITLLARGDSQLSGVKGYVYMYLLGPTGEDAPAPSISVTLTAAEKTVTKTITQANVVGSSYAGVRLQAPPEGPSASYRVGASDAMDGPRPYRALLRIYTAQRVDPSKPAGWGNAAIRYFLHREGDLFTAATGQNVDETRVTLTDSQGWTSDNAGAWTIEAVTD